MPQLHRTTSYSQASLLGGSTAGRDYTAGSPSGALVGHWVRGGYSGHHEGSSYYPSHCYPESSLRTGTSTSAKYLDRYTPLERYVSYEADHAERAVEGIGRL
jgi:hypothetical protein